MLRGNFPQAIFSHRSGGKIRMQNQIYGSANMNNLFFEKDKEIIKSLIDFISDDKNYSYPSRTVHPS